MQPFCHSILGMGFFDTTFPVYGSEEVIQTFNWSLLRVLKAVLKAAFIFSAILLAVAICMIDVRITIIIVQKKYSAK